MISTAKRSFILLFFFSVGIIGIGAFLYANSQIRYETEVLMSADRQSISLATDALAQRLRSVTADLEFLSKLPSIRRAIQNPDRADLDTIEEDFSAYINAHSTFDQLRWIDQTGKERVRVNFSQGVAQAVQEEALQDKSERGYVSEALGIDDGGIYLSPFDLNVEHGEVEKPYKPVIRFAKPLVDAKEGRQGLIVINYRGQSLLYDFVRSIGDQSARITLVNRDGYWLRGDRPEDEWGFMLDQPTTLKNRNPAVWAAVSAENFGQQLLPDGVWTWSTIRPRQEVELSFAYSRHEMPAIHASQDYVWRAIMQIPASRLTEIKYRVWESVALPIGLLVLIAALVIGKIVGTQRKIESLNEALADRAAAAEAAAQTKASFLANMSHEIRTPMNAIIGLAYVLEQSHLPKDAGDLIRKIRSAGRSMLGIINDILDFSKIEAGRLELEHVPFQLGDVLDNLSTIMSANAGDKDIELIIANPPHGIDRLRGDALRLEQILINLTGNAIKFTEKGHVWVTIEILAQEAEFVTLRFSVHDTGVGIPEDKQREIFTPFGQADTSTTRRFGGTGLGLSISRRLVALMGGEMGVVSAPGRGSQFWFTLNLETVRQAAPATPEMSHLTLFVADDNSIALDAIRGMALALGWNSLGFNGGKPIVEYLSSLHQAGPNDKSHVNKVALLDWNMPDMSGLEVAQAIRSGGDCGDECRIVLMVAGSARNELANQPGISAVDGVITKPITVSSLYNGIATALNQRGLTLVPELNRKETQRLDGICLLVVDDSEINREVANRILSGEGAHVELAANGKAAIEWLAAHGDEVDVVLMDVQMPVMDGYEATRQIRANPKFSNLPVVALTAGAFKSQQDMARAAGMVDFIAKPFDVDAAITLIQSLVQSSVKRADSPRVIKAAKDSGEEMPTASIPANPATDHLPGLDLEQGRRIWAAPEEHQKWLRKFAADYATSVASMRSGDVGQATSLAHKMCGAAGNLGLTEVAKVAREICDTLEKVDDPEALFAKLELVLATATASIARYAPEHAAASIQAATPEQLKAILSDLLRALDDDSINAVEPIIAGLATKLPAEVVQVIQSHVENFDFRAAEEATRQLAEKLRVPLED